MFEVGTEGFASGFFIALEVEQVVGHLEGHTQRPAIRVERVALGLRSAGMDPHEPARGGHEFGSFAFDDVHVIGFGKQPVACLEVLLQFAFAHFAGGFSHFQRDPGIAHLGRQDKSMAEEVVAQ